MKHRNFYAYRYAPSKACVCEVMGRGFSGLDAPSNRKSCIACTTLRAGLITALFIHPICAAAGFECPRLGSETQRNTQPIAHWQTSGPPKQPETVSRDTPTPRRGRRNSFSRSLKWIHACRSCHHALTGRSQLQTFALTTARSSRPCPEESAYRC